MKSEIFPKKDIILIPQTFIEHSISQHCPEYITYIKSANPSKNPMMWVLLLSELYI